MANNSIIDLVSLDPDLNKQAFINYLQNQSRFKGYNYAGDDMNILLDLFGINTYRYAFLLNMAISEGFIDSAQLGSSIKSHAKELGYTPRSSTSAIANVNVSFTASGVSQPYVIPKGSTFSSTVKNQNFVFSIAEPIIVSSANNLFQFTTNLYEGVYVKDAYIYNPAAIPLSFPITNANVDTSSIVVNIFGNNNLIGVNYNLANSLLGLTGNSLVYFLQCAAANGAYEVLFGDGIFGYQPDTGATVIIDYRIASGNTPNGCGTFTCNFDPTGAQELTSGVTVITNEIASGGTAPESIETTRFYAPRWYQVQERCIVPSDYQIVLQQQFPEIQAINAYGGETLNPPQFGRVIIALQISGVNGLPISKVNEYTSFIKARNPISIQPFFVAANNTYLQIDTTVKYNINVTLESDATIATIVTNAINQYNANNLNDFDVTFYYQPFTEVINSADPSIVSSLTNVLMYQKIYPSQNPANFTLNYAVPLMNNNPPLGVTVANNVQTTVSSSSFMYQGALSQLMDDGNGIIRIANITGAGNILAANVGTVQYSNGIVQLTQLTVDSFDGSSLQVFVNPAEDDISCNQNVILSIEPSAINVTVQQLSL